MAETSEPNINPNLSSPIEKGSAVSVEIWGKTVAGQDICEDIIRETPPVGVVVDVMSGTKDRPMPDFGKKFSLFLKMIHQLQEELLNSCKTK